MGPELVCAGKNSSKLSSSEIVDSRVLRTCGYGVTCDCAVDEITSTHLHLQLDVHFISRSPCVSVGPENNHACNFIKKNVWKFGKDHHDDLSIHDEKAWVCQMRTHKCNEQAPGLNFEACGGCWQEIARYSIEADFGISCQG